MILKDVLQFIGGTWLLLALLLVVIKFEFALGQPNQELALSLDHNWYWEILDYLLSKLDLKTGYKKWMVDLDVNNYRTLQKGWFICCLDIGGTNCVLELRNKCNFT